MTSQDTYKRCLTAEQERMGERTIKLRKKLISTKQNIDCEMTTKAKTYDNYTIELGYGCRKVAQFDIEIFSFDKIYFHSIKYIFIR